MPRSGFRSASSSRTGTRPVASSLARASPKAPTPGRMMRSAARRRSASPVTSVSRPRARRLDCRENRFPTP